MITLFQFFSSPGDDLLERLGDALGSDEAAVSVRAPFLKELSKIRWNLFSDAVREQFAKLLDISLVDIMTAAWRKHEELRRHLDPELAQGGEAVLLPLAEHRIESSHSPCVEILKSGRRIAKITFPVRITLQLEGFVLKIQDREIREVRTGRIQARGSVRCEGVVLVEKSFQPIALPGVISLQAAGATPPSAGPATA